MNASNATEAEVAFVIQDEHQGRGLGTIFLEHIAQAARERGMRRFVAEVLPDNQRMFEVFHHAGYFADHPVRRGHSAPRLRHPADHLVTGRVARA